jgi:hypothetical protein
VCVCERERERERERESPPLFMCVCEKEKNQVSLARPPLCVFLSIRLNRAGKDCDGIKHRFRV